MTTTIYDGYPGSKAAAGVAERIAGLFPTHRGYVELFLGHGAVMRRKTAAQYNIGVDVDANVCRRWERARPYLPEKLRNVDIQNVDAFAFLGTDAPWLNRQWVLYVDAPYLLDVRTRLFYAHELEKPEQHAALLDRVTRLECNVAISHYWHPLYASKLFNWRMVTIPAMTRGGLRLERVWCNFPPPLHYHDPMLANVGYRERERVKKKARRWRRMLLGMTTAERAVVRRELAAAESEALIDAGGGENHGDDAASTTAGGDGAGSETLFAGATQ